MALAQLTPWGRVILQNSV